MCIYGQIVDEDLFKSISTMQNVTYGGFLQLYDEYHNTLLDADVMVAIYTECTPSHSLTMHNKTLEAMMAGVPILGDNGRKAFVEKYNWGVMEQKLFDAYKEIV